MIEIIKTKDNLSMRIILLNVVCLNICFYLLLKNISQWMIEWLNEFSLLGLASLPFIFLSCLRTFDSIIFSLCSLPIIKSFNFVVLNERGIFFMSTHPSTWPRGCIHECVGKFCMYGHVLGCVLFLFVHGLVHGHVVRCV